jgi:sugar phosphate isomerase/epimerase
VGFAFDLGHAHLGQSVPGSDHAPAKSALELAFAAFAPVAAKVAAVHVHDNNGVRDEHLWPMATKEAGSIDWAHVRSLLAGFGTADLFLEIAHELGEEPAVVVERAKAGWGVVGL